MLVLIRIALVAVLIAHSKQLVFMEKSARLTLDYNQMSRFMRKPAFCICKNKDTVKLCDNCAADQHLCFRYSNMDSPIPLFPKSQIPSLYPSSIRVSPSYFYYGAAPCPFSPAPCPFSQCHALFLNLHIMHYILVKKSSKSDKN